MKKTLIPGTMLNRYLLKDEKYRKILEDSNNPFHMIGIVEVDVGDQKNPVYFGIFMIQKDSGRKYLCSGPGINPEIFQDTLDNYIKFPAEDTVILLVKTESNWTRYDPLTETGIKTSYDFMKSETYETAFLRMFNQNLKSVEIASITLN